MSVEIPILLMVQELGIGGSERQMTEVARALDRSKFQPHVSSMRPEGFRADELRHAGVPVVRFPTRSFRSPSVLRAGRQMGMYLRQHDIRIVHTFDAPSNLFGVFTARAHRTPAVVISSQRAFRSLTGRLHRLLRITDHLVDAIVVNCKAIEHHLIADEGVPASRIRLCYNGIDLEQFQPGSRIRQPVLQDAGCVVGCVCALRPEKGLPTLLKAFARVRNVQPGLKLVIVGSGPVLPDLEKLAAELDIGGQCLFEAANSSVAEWMRSIDIFVLPSLSEALSNSLLEAMACGCCPVASKVGGNVELIAPGHTGLLFPARDEAALAAQLEILIHNQALRRRMAGESVAFVRSGFSLQTSVARMMEIYTELLAVRSPCPHS